jgi:hypothetical protein
MLDDGGDPATIFSIAITKSRDQEWHGAVDGLTIKNMVDDFEENGIFYPAGGITARVGSAVVPFWGWRYLLLRAPASTGTTVAVTYLASSDTSQTTAFETSIPPRPCREGLQAAIPP